MFGNILTEIFLWNKLESNGLSLLFSINFSSRFLSKKSCRSFIWKKWLLLKPRILRLIKKSPFHCSN